MLFQMRKVKVDLKYSLESKGREKKNAKERERKRKWGKYENGNFWGSNLQPQGISFKLAIKSSFCFGLWSKEPFMSDIFLLEVDNWFDENTHSNYYDVMW